MPLPNSLCIFSAKATTTKEAANTKGKIVAVLGRVIAGFGRAKLERQVDKGRIIPNSLCKVDKVVCGLVDGVVGDVGVGGGMVDDAWFAGKRLFSEFITLIT